MNNNTPPLVGKNEPQRCSPFKSGIYGPEDEAMAWAITGSLIATGIIAVDFRDRYWAHELQRTVETIAQIHHLHVEE